MADREFPQPVITPGPVTDRDIYTVARLLGEVRQLLEQGFAEIWIEGEITNLVKAGSGHYYFSLKDETAEVRCALFRTRADALGMDVADGSKVLARARVTLYEPRGAFQLIVQYLEDAGEGELRRQFEALKQKLLKEGLFDPAHKKTLPLFPATVGLITSPSGAALHDLLTTFHRRCPAIRLIIYPTSVQGERAPQEIIAALGLANTRQECDALILARGGGSLEDLKAFNDEQVARAVYACKLPIVCGVGHEIDVSICDLVADERAATPTAAAERVSPQSADWLQKLDALRRHLLRITAHKLSTYMQRNDELGHRIVRPEQRLEQGRERLLKAELQLRHLAMDRLQDSALSLMEFRSRLAAVTPRGRIRQDQTATKGLAHRLRSATTHSLSHHEQLTQGLAARLHTVSPLATLERGFAVVKRHDSGKIVREAENAPVGEKVDIQLAKGGLLCTVNKHRT